VRKIPALDVQRARLFMSTATFRMLLANRRWSTFQRAPIEIFGAKTIAA